MNNIQQISIEDVNYPTSLKRIKDAPKILYYRGNFISNEDCIAIVGTRRPSPYGQQAAFGIANDLINANVTIVSGLAPGIDTFVHAAAVEKNKRTIAVLGTGLDEKSIYPQQNVQLAKKIIETGGCLISELPPGSHGSKFTFPKRNRIISALSLGTVVIEAKEKSGSLITARYAKEQGKKLFAVPGPIFSLNSAGPNYLIKKGAELITSAADILEKLNISFVKTQQELTSNNQEETLILNILKEEALPIDKIIEKTNLPAPIVASTLALMEISGRVRNLGGSVYSLF